jgi:2-hydroxychromene-2-carboxylate isomerase
VDLDFYYDIVCPYAYLASTRVEGLAARTGATLRYQPFLLGGVFAHHQAPQVPAATWSSQRVRLGALDVLRQAERWGVPLRFPGGHPRRTVEAMRLLTAAPTAARPALTAALFAAYWEEGRDLADRAALAPLAEAHGVPLDAIDRPATKEALRAATADAAARGVFGAPSFFVGERMWWGNDRMHLVEEALGGPAAPRPGVAPMSTGSAAPDAPLLTFFHDFSSPFSYLGSARVSAIAEAAGARLSWRPILLGALFREIGTPDVPLFAMHAARQAAILRDMHDQARWLGVPFRVPEAFPLRTVTALRLALLEPRLTPALYRAAWAEGRDLGDPAVLAAVLAEEGADAGLLARAGEPAVKEALRQNTAAAVAAGACGVPSFELRLPGRAPLLVWGVDRLDLVEAMLGGWRPAGE